MAGGGVQGLDCSAAQANARIGTNEVRPIGEIHELRRPLGGDGEWSPSGRPGRR
jgi:hypothetical protein